MPCLPLSNTGPSLCATVSHHFLPYNVRCFVTTKTGDLRDDACGDGRSGEVGTSHIDASYGYTFGIDNGSGLGGAGAEVGIGRRY